MKLLSTLTVFSLGFSTVAWADFEAGAHGGYNVMSTKGANDSPSGPAMGIRAGMGVGFGLTPELNITRYSATPADGGEDATVTQIQTGLGARFYVGDFFLRPFIAGHLNYAMAASAGSGTVPDSSGLGIDVGAGLQLKFLDLIYTELHGSYARILNDAEISNIYAGLGLGVKL
jgi:hypothetical protein